MSTTSIEEYRLAKRGCGEKNIEKLAYGEGDEADETDKANVSKDFLVMTAPTIVVISKHPHERRMADE